MSLALLLPAQPCLPACSHWYTMPWGSSRLARCSCPTAPEYMGRKQLQFESMPGNSLENGAKGKGWRGAPGSGTGALPHHCPRASAAEKAVEQQDVNTQAGQGAATTVCCYPESKQEPSGCSPSSR